MKSLFIFDKSLNVCSWTDKLVLSDELSQLAFILQHTTRGMRNSTLLLM